MFLEKMAPLELLRKFIDNHHFIILPRLSSETQESIVLVLVNLKKLSL